MVLLSLSLSAKVFEFTCAAIARSADVAAEVCRSADRGSISSVRRAQRGSGAKASATPDHPGARAETAASEDQDLHMIPSPIVGTFYRRRRQTAIRL